jgi:hypothetical protein
MLLAATVTPPEEPGLWFTESCLPVVMNLMSLPLDEGNEDVDTDADDHIWDTLRYRLLRKSIMVVESEVLGA